MTWLEEKQGCFFKKKKNRQKSLFLPSTSKWFKGNFGTWEWRILGSRFHRHKAQASSNANASKEMTHSFLAVLRHPPLQIVNKNGFKMASEWPRLEDCCRNVFIQYLSTSPSFPLLFSFTLTSTPHAVMVTSLECLVVPKFLRIHWERRGGDTSHKQRRKEKKWATWR